MTTIGDQARFVATAAIRQAVAGRETDLIDALGVDWRAGRPHIICPYPGHDDGDPSWRWDARKSRAFCTCTKGDSVFDVIMKVQGSTFDAAKVRVAELLNRHDLIRSPGRGGSQHYQATDAASLLDAPADRRDDRLPIAYLAHRLGVTADAVPIPRTPMLGLKALAYYDPRPTGSPAKPKRVGDYPCAVFGTVAADGRTHAHRIYLAPGGAGKADLGASPDGHPRDIKKTAKVLGDDNTAGRSVLWGDVNRASQIVIAEGIETGAAVALALTAEIEAGQMAVAAAISANGVEAFQPYPATVRVTVAADRDEAPKSNGKPGSGRGEQAAGAFALRHRGALDTAIALPGQPGEAVDWLDLLRRDGVDAVRAGILAATPLAPVPAELDAAKLGDAPAIRVMGGDLASAVAAALAVLASETDPLAAVYVRANLLVIPTRVRNRLNLSGIRRPMDALILCVVDADWLGLRLAQLASFYVIRDQKAKPVDPPVRLCRSVLADAPWPQLPTLAGIIEAPTVRPDGSLLTKPGYDEATGLLFDPGDTHFPPIPSAPTREQAEAALRTLAVPLRDFSFVDDAARSVALAAVITMLVRRTLRAAPLFAFDAPKMASGKTLIATVASYIATGRGPYLMAQVADATDERKRLLAALLEGPTAVVIDNVELPLRSDALCIALTEPSFSDRLLGASKTATVATNCCFVATGNNLIIAGDLSARALVCRIDPEVERPEEREFSVDLHSWVPAHRGELVAAALTIVRAYLVAGAPKLAVPNFARFEAWQRLCRFPLIWLGLADPCDTRRRIEQADPVRESLRALLAAWHQQFGDGRSTIKAAIETAARAPELQSVMEAIAGEKGGVNARRLGRFLMKHERRIENGLRFVKDGTRGGVAYWRAEDGGFGGFGGFPPSPSREKANGGEEVGKLIDRLGTNPPNPPNQPSDPVEVEL